MTFGKRIWLVISVLAAIFVMNQTLRQGFDGQFLLSRDGLNILFASACCVLGSSVYQILRFVLQSKILPLLIAGGIYLGYLVFQLPYPSAVSLVIGAVVMIVGILHYAVSVAFFGKA